MTELTKQEINVFYCYAREDKALREELDIHLSSLKRQYHLTTWSDHEILPGEDFEKVIGIHLSSADLILLLISPYFMNSDYCYSKEMQRALARHQEGTSVVIPILLYPTLWEGAPFSHIQMLPTDAKAITSWSNQYEAFHDVVKGINSTIKNIIESRKTQEAFLQEDNTVRNLSSEHGSNFDYTTTLKRNGKRTPAAIIYFLGLSSTIFGLMGTVIEINPVMLFGSIAVCLGLIVLFLGIVMFSRTYHRIQYIGCLQYFLWTMGVFFSTFITLILLSLYNDKYVTGALFYAIFLIYGLTLVMLAYKKPSLTQQAKIEPPKQNPSPILKNQ